MSKQERRFWRCVDTGGNRQTEAYIEEVSQRTEGFRVEGFATGGPSQHVLLYSFEDHATKPPDFMDHTRKVKER